MRDFFIALILALSPTVATAVSTCDTLPSKAQRINCWSNLVGSYQAEADEYAFAVQESKRVPPYVKRNVELKRQAISQEAQKRCRKDDLGYPENKCYISIIERFKDYTYQETSKYGVKDQRLN